MTTDSSVKCKSNRREGHIAIFRNILEVAIFDENFPCHYCNWQYFSVLKQYCWGLSPIYLLHSKRNRIFVALNIALIPKILPNAIMAKIFLSNTAFLKILQKSQYFPPVYCFYILLTLSLKATSSFPALQPCTFQKYAVFFWFLNGNDVVGDQCLFHS